MVNFRKGFTSHHQNTSTFVRQKITDRNSSRKKYKNIFLIERDQIISAETAYFK